MKLYSYVWLLNHPHSLSLEWTASAALFTAPVWWHLYVVQRICWEAQPCSLSLWRCQGERHTCNVHKGVSAAVCVSVCENLPYHVFEHNLSNILYSNCTAVCIHSCRHVCFCQDDTTSVQLCAGRESAVCACVRARKLQSTVCPSKLWSLHSCFGFLNCIVSVFKMFLLEVLTPTFYINHHYYMFYNHTRK